jgi:hypothetical protein
MKNEDQKEVKEVKVKKKTLIEGMQAYNKCLDLYELKPIPQIILTALILKWNDKFRHAWFEYSNLELAKKIHVSKMTTVVKYRNELVDLGLIEFKPGKPPMINAYRICFDKMQSIGSDCDSDYGSLPIVTHSHYDSDPRSLSIVTHGHYDSDPRSLSTPLKPAQEAVSQPPKSLKERKEKRKEKDQSFLRESGAVERDEKNGCENGDDLKNTDPISEVLESSNLPKDICELILDFIRMKAECYQHIMTARDVTNLIVLLNTYTEIEIRQSLCNATVGQYRSVQLPSSYKQPYRKNTKMDLDHDYNMDEIDDVLFGEY